MQTETAKVAVPPPHGCRAPGHSQGCSLHLEWLFPFKLSILLSSLIGYAGYKLIV
jgi:hypothetical protein